MIRYAMTYNGRQGDGTQYIHPFVLEILDWLHMHKCVGVTVSDCSGVKDHAKLTFEAPFNDYLYELLGDAGEYTLYRPLTSTPEIYNDLDSAMKAVYAELWEFYEFLSVRGAEHLGQTTKEYPR